MKNIVVLSPSAMLWMTTKKMIQRKATIPLKKVNLTTFVLDDFLGMTFGVARLSHVLDG